MSMREYVDQYVSREALWRVVRTFLIAFAAVTLPGSLGWLNDVTAWAAAEGQAPFPDAAGLGFLAVSGIVAGTVALLNLIVVVVEDVTGHAVGRSTPTAGKRRKVT